MLFMLANLPRLIGAAFDATGNGGYLAEAALIRYGSSMVEAVQLNENGIGSGCRNIKPCMNQVIFKFRKMKKSS